MDENLLLFAVVGFAAQMIDGALGMAYGLSSTTFLLSFGIPPVAASASVHTAEVVTTSVSGLFHWRLGNVDRKLFRKLVIPGVVGGILGAYFLSAVPGERIKPFVSLYLLVMGMLILRKALRKAPHAQKKTWVTGLGFTGGLLDAVGGGGWGPIVTSTLVFNGSHPRFAIGSVNLAEFFVTVAQAGVFFVTLGLLHSKIVLGLILGGFCAAPLAAHVCKRIPSRGLMILVATLIIALSLRTIYLTAF